MGRGLSRRDRNLLKIMVMVPMVAGLIGWAVYSALRIVGLGGSPVLATVGFMASVYLVARILIARRGLSRPSPALDRKKESAYIQSVCGNSALVTGCTAGLGLAWVEGLCARGCSVVCVSRSQSKLEALASRMKEAYPEVHIETVVHDFARADNTFYEELLPAVMRKCGVGLVINNVGIGTEDPLPLNELKLSEDIDAMITINCGATSKMCAAALPVLQARSGGAIINVSSGSAAQPTPYLTVYAATKAFITHLSRSLDREQIAQKTKVKVLCAQPYYISGTGLFKSTKASFNAPSAPTVVDGTLKDLSRRSHAIEISHTSPGHAFIHFLFVNIAEDPALAPVARFIAKLLRFNGSMLMVMTQARHRFLLKCKK